MTLKTENRTALMPLELCTLIAHETVSLLSADADALNTAAQLREGLTILAAAIHRAGHKAFEDHSFFAVRQLLVRGHFADAPTALPKSEY